MWWRGATFGCQGECMKRACAGRWLEVHQRPWIQAKSASGAYPSSASSYQNHIDRHPSSRHAAPGSANDPALAALQLNCPACPTPPPPHPSSIPAKPPGACWLRWAWSCWATAACMWCQSCCPPCRPSLAWAARMRRCPTR